MPYSFPSPRYRSAPAASTLTMPVSACFEPMDCGSGDSQGRHARLSPHGPAIWRGGLKSPAR